MATGKVYYIGEGVLHFKEPHKNGVDIKHGDVLPAAMPPETIAKLVKGGKASDRPPMQRGAAEAGELGRLGDQVQALRVELQNAGARIDTLTTERDQASQAATAGSAEIGRLQGALATVTTERDTIRGERDAARDTVANLEKTIAEMTEAATGAAEVGKGAGPKK